MIKIIAVLIGTFFFLIGVLTLPDYTQNWDEAAHFNRGLAILHYMLTGKKDYQDLPPVPKYAQKDDTVLFYPLDKNKKEIYRRSIYEDNQINFNFFLSNYGHPPVSDIVAAVFNKILFQQLGFINDVDSFHVYSIFVASLLVSVIYWWIAKSYGNFAGLIASLSLMLYPLFLGESRYNIKDIPQAVFYGLMLICFYESIVRKSVKWIIASALCFGVAVGTKFNVLFAPFILVPWLLVYFFRSKSLPKDRGFLIISLTSMLVVGGGLLFACWPYLWSSPVSHFMNIVLYYREIGTSIDFDPRFLTFFRINTYAIQWILYSTPLVTLFFVVYWILFGFRKSFQEKSGKMFLVFLWLVVPIGRVSMPNAGIYGGGRQIMEYVPALAIIAGLGAREVRNWIYRLVTKKRDACLSLAVSLVFLLSFLPILRKLIQIHPNEAVYFNPIIGGLRGAKQRGMPEWGQNLGSINKLGIRWINRNAEPNAKLVTNFGLGSSIPVIFLRNDIYFSNNKRSAGEQKGEYIIGLTHLSGFEDIYYFQYNEKVLKPLYEAKVDNVPLLKIWKNDPQYAKAEYQNIIPFSDFKIVKKSNTLLLTLGQEVYLMKMIVQFNNPLCARRADGKLVISDDNVELAEGSVEISTDNDFYILLDGDLHAQIFLAEITYRDNGEFIYYFAAKRAKYIRMQFNPANPCFTDIKSIQIFGVENKDN